MKDILIAYCGLDCSKCEARIATINDDNDLRKKVAKEWSKLNNAEITEEMINCVGCKVEGVKTPFCEKLCPIRQCAINKKVESCGKCEMMENCNKVAMVISNNLDALNNLKS